MSIVLVGSTSGSVTLQEPAVAGTTVLTLPAVSGTVITTGTTGQVIASGALPIGSVLQVVNLNLTTASTTNSSSWVTSGLTLSITPKFSTSKIFIIANFGIYMANQQSNIMSCSLFRGATNLGNTDSGMLDLYPNSTTNAGTSGGGNLSYVDSPATTSATTYAVYLKSGGTTVFGIGGYNGRNTTSNITLMEIAG
jgi:hypothetical protein